MKSTIQVIATSMILMLLFSCNRSQVNYSSSWEDQPDRVWIGPEYWANRLQDWRIEHGKMVCTNTTLGLRTVHILTQQVGDHYGKLEIDLTLGLDSTASRKGNDGWAGILVGAGEGKMDYRASALIHHSPGDAGGIIIAVNENGQVIFLDNTGNREVIGSMQQLPEQTYPDSLRLTVDVYMNDDSTYTISASATDLLSRDQLNHNNLTKIPFERLRGNIAVAANHLEKGGKGYWFGKLNMKGDALVETPGHRFGPFMGVMYTLNDDILKLTAQMPPVGEADDPFVRMWVRENGNIEWTEIDSSLVSRDAFIATFRIEDWVSDKEHEYRLAYRLQDKKSRRRTYYLSGTIKADPSQQAEVVAGAFSCISHMEGVIDGNRCDYPDRLWFPHTDFTRSVARQEPDILFFTGDQVYEGRPTYPDFSSPENTELDYLYKWYLFLWATGDLMRSTPAVCIPDDHDVYHGNIWGAGGKTAPVAKDSAGGDISGLSQFWQQDQGGYKLRPSTVNMIQATQTSHLPDPYDPAPAGQGIGVYYTDLNYGRISFAILEDRKFKSAPAVVLPEARVVNGFAQNPYISGRGLDDPEAKLLGDRQLAFLDAWTSDWKYTDMKATISQTIFANLSTYPDTFRTDAGTPKLTAPPPGVIPGGYRKARDMDSNGWPQTARNKALKEIRKGFAVMIAGDQHLGSLTHMGVDTWDDAGYSFCVPAIGNLWPRRWFPSEPGRDHQEGMPMYTGKYFDGFGNRVTVWAVANPVDTNREPEALYNRAVGYGIIRFNKSAGTITFECWRRDAMPSEGKSGMYPGWPKTVGLLENYDRPVRTWLPNYQVSGLVRHPVFQVTDESTGEIIYTVRVPSDNYQPGVFTYGGTYTVKIGDPDTGDFREFESVRARYNRDETPVMVSF